MARQQTHFRNLKSIAGAAFIGLGVFILYSNLAEAAGKFGHLLGIAAEEETLGPLIAAGLAVWHALQAYWFNHREFLQGFHLILISFWPLLLVIAGSIVLRVGSADKAKEHQKKWRACRFLCVPFDVSIEPESQASETVKGL